MPQKWNYLEFVAYIQKEKRTILARFENIGKSHAAIITISLNVRILRNTLQKTLLSSLT